jgi:hypothetical protein
MRLHGQRSHVGVRLDSYRVVVVRAMRGVQRWSYCLRNINQTGHREGLHFYWIFSNTAEDSSCSVARHASTRQQEFSHAPGGRSLHPVGGFLASGEKPACVHADEQSATRTVIRA